MAFPWGAAGLAFRIFGPVLASFGGPVRVWWLQRQIRPATGEKLSVLVSRISGDGPASSNQRSIREAIAKALPEIEVRGWPLELQIPDGEERESQASAHRLARKWLRAKNCNLLIAGRMKNNSIISLMFIPAGAPQASHKDISGAQTYSLSLD